MGHIVNNVFRFLFAWIDSLVIRLITMMYKLFTNMTDLVIYSDNIIKTIGRRIGLILGIFMLFKLAISLINYMISPDKISDKSQGGGKLIVNVIISLALLISVNFIFKEAYMLQSKVVNSHIIEKIFFGDYGIVKSTNDNESGTIKMDIGYYLYSGFFPPNEKVFKDVCDDMWDVSTDITIAQEGQRSCNDLLGEYLSDDERSNIYRARNTLDLSYVYSDWDTVNARYGNNYVFDYMSIISTAAGVICLIIMISFSMSLATRAIKLFFLQIVAPIPIISNMDLGKGQDIFKKWVKQCVNTYLTVFIRIIALDFAVFMIVLLRGNYKNVFTNNVWLNIFLIIGCLFFAKEVPKLLEDLFGIKMDGMTLHPLKNFQENALFGKNITGLAAGAAVGTFGSLSGAGITQGLKGAWSGMIGGKGFGETWKGQVGANKTMREALRDGSTFWGRRAAHLTSTLGVPTPSESIESQVHKIDEEIKDIDNKMKPMNDSIADRDAYTSKVKSMEERAQQKIKDGDAGIISQQYKAMVNRAEKLREDLRNNRAGVTAQMVAEAEMKANTYLTNTGTYEYIDYTTGLSNSVSEYMADGNATGVSLDSSFLNSNNLSFKDGAMISMNDDLVSMTKTPTTYNYEDANGVTRSVTIDSTAVSRGASLRHGHANDVSGSVNSDKRTVVAKASAAKQAKEQEKAKLYERQRKRQADQRAIGK